MLVIQRPSVEAIGDDHPIRQRFAIGPLEPGFGHTIGNSLRRTLLSSIPGAAITTVKFDNAQHEFTTIPGMSEDITEFILNLKDIVITSTSDEPVVLRLDVKGPMTLTAGDIPCPADVEVLNKDLYLATLNAGAQLALDITVEQGRGYLSSERDADDRIIGVITVDAIFSPVRRVMFDIDQHVLVRAPTTTALFSTSKQMVRSHLVMHLHQQLQHSAHLLTSSPTCRKSSRDSSCQSQSVQTLACQILIIRSKTWISASVHATA